MGKLVITYADFDGEVSTVGMPLPDLTAANIDTEYADAIALRAALADVLLGKELRYQVTAKVAPQGVGRSANELAQREAKALVRYHDSVTFEKASLELPCVDLSKQNANYPGVFFLYGAANNHADWITFVGAFQTKVPGPGGNAAVVDDIIHVGRNL